jgi:hypothetical protein
MKNRIYQNLYLVMLGVCFTTMAMADPIASAQNIVNYVINGMRALAVLPFAYAAGNYYFGQGEKAKTHIVHGIIGAIIIFGISGIMSTLSSKIQN